MTFLIYFIVWHYFRKKLPRNKKGKIGLVLSIQSENDKQKIRIKNDFFEKLKELLKENNILESFDILFLNEYQTERVNKILMQHSELLNRCRKNDYELSVEDKKIKENWQNIARKIRGNFWVWGNIKERLQGENKYFFNLEARVLHSPLPSNVNNPLKRAFDESWIKKISIDEKAESIGFEFTAELVFIGLNYVTGIAAYISNDPITAYKLHESLLNELNKKFPTLPPNLNKIQKNIIKFLADECVLIAHNYLLQADKTNSKLFIDKIFQYSKDNYDGYLLKSVYLFSLENDPLKSIETCDIAMKFSGNNGTWRYNKAFLLLYLNRYPEALKLYSEIENINYKDEEMTLTQVIYFNENRIKSVPYDFRSNFVLGFVYLRKKNNPAHALEYFESIEREYSNIHDLKDLIKRVKGYLIEIRRSIKIS